MDKRRKPQSYHQYNNKKSKQNFLDVGLKGYLCSCNFREKDCIRESYNILNKYADILYPEEGEDKINVKPWKEDKTEKEEDVLDDLAAEINQLKSDHATPSARRFNAVQTGVKNILFITTSIENPVELATKIVEDINNSKLPQTRYLIRLVPIEIICKATLTSIIDSFKPLVEKHFKVEPTTFSIAFNHRYNNNVPKDEVIKSLADLVVETNREHKVNLTQPKLTVIVEIIKGFALLSVVPDYIRYKKYNLLSAAEENKDQKILPADVGQDIEEIDSKEPKDSDKNFGEEIPAVLESEEKPKVIEDFKSASAEATDIL